MCSTHVTPRPPESSFSLPNNSTWKEHLAPNYGIQLIEVVEDIPDQLKGDNVLWSSRCSRTKTGLDQALPKDFYVSAINLKFYEMMHRNNLRYGILSDKYGIHMDDEFLDYYDIHPSELTGERKRELGLMIGEKVRNYGYEELIFYNTSPLQSRPYFEMLWWSELKVHFISLISLVEEKYKLGSGTVKKTFMFPLFNIHGATTGRIKGGEQSARPRSE